MPAPSLDMTAKPRAYALFKRRLGPGMIARGCALIDQGLTGVGNVLVFALLGRALPLIEFGAIGMMIGVHYFIAGFHRSAVALPFATDYRTAGDAARVQARNSAWWWLGLACAIALSAALGIVGGLIAAWAPSGWQWAVSPLLLAALISPAMLIWEFARRWLYKIDRADIVAIGSAAYALTLCLIAWIVSRAHPTAMAAALAWIFASTLAAVITWPFMRPARPDRAAISWLLIENRRSSGWLAATHVPYAFYSSATVVVVIGAIVGPVAAAIFTAARTITNPAISIVSAIDSIDKVRAARALAEGGVDALKHSVRRMRLLIVASTAVYLGGVALFAEPLTRLFFKDHFPGIAGNVQLLALAFFLFGLNQPSETTMIVLRAGRTMLVVRTITAIATVAALFAAKPWGVSGMAMAICATQALNLAILALAERRLMRDHRRIAT